MSRHGTRWNRLYRSMSYVRSALWLVPLAAVVLALARIPDPQGLGGTTNRPQG